MKAVFVWPYDPKKCRVWGPFGSVELAFEWAASEGLTNGFATEITKPTITPADMRAIKKGARSLKKALAKK